MREIKRIIICLLFFILNCNLLYAQFDYWKVLLPGYQCDWYNAEIDHEGNLNMVLPAFSPTMPDKFISFDKNGYVKFNQNTYEIGLLNFRDSTGNRYLVSYMQPEIRIQKFDSKDSLLWNHAEPLQFPVIVSVPGTSEMEFVHSTSHLFLSNGNLAIAGIFHGGDALPSVLYVDTSNGAITNEYYGPNTYFAITEIDLQEDDNENINMAYYTEISDIFYVDKITQAGALTTHLLFGGPPDDDIPVAFEMTDNYYYIGVLDDILGTFIITKLDKNSLGIVYSINTGITNWQYPDKFGATDSGVFISNPSGLRTYFNGVLQCTHPGIALQMVCRDMTLYSIGGTINTLDTSCIYTSLPPLFDSNTGQLIQNHILDPAFPNDHFTNDELIYIVSKNNSNVLGVVALVNSRRTNFSGRLYFDSNNSCTADSLEPGIPNQLIRLNPSGELLFTEQDGFYENVADTGNYTIEAIPFNTTLTRCPASISLAVADTVMVYSGNDLGIQDLIGNMQDLSITINQSPAIPGFNSHIFIMIQNLQPIPANGLVKLTLDTTLFSILYATTLADSISGNEYFWHINNVEFMTPRSIFIQCFVDSMAVPGNSFTTDVTVTNNLSEFNLSNNSDSHQGVVLSSYDPNNKSVTPRGYGAIGLISPADSVLRYRINFQNTGTYTAYKIFLIDTIDPSVDISTFQLLSTSHNCQLSFLDTNVIKFTFEDIMLPDSGSNELLSHGFVNYSIHTKQNLPISTEIKNRASIYFDSNLPIQTNQTVNTIGVLGYEEVLQQTGMYIYPNPATEQLHIVLNETNIIKEILVFDVEGRIVQHIHSGINGNNCTITLSGLKNGFYFVKAQTSDGSYVKRFVKM